MPSSSRPSLKQARSADELRRSMTARRCTLATTIRKAKKSERLLEKRQHVYTDIVNTRDGSGGEGDLPMDQPKASTSPQISSNMSTKLTNLAWDYVRSNGNAESLAALQAAVIQQEQSTDAAFSTNTTGLAYVLADWLARTLRQYRTLPYDATLAGRILTTLAAASEEEDAAMEENTDNSSSYGRVNDTLDTGRVSWCTVLVQSQVFPALLELLEQYADTTGNQPNGVQHRRNDNTMGELAQQACSIIGNVSHDQQQQQRQEQLYSPQLNVNSCAPWHTPALETLVRTLVAAWQLKHVHVTRQATWALNSFLLHTLTAHETLTSVLKLLPAWIPVVIEVLRSPESASAPDRLEWYDTANEVCSTVLICVRENQTAILDCIFDERHGYGMTLIQTLAFRLEQAAAEVQGTLQASSTAPAPVLSSVGIRSCLLCLQAMGHMATVSRGEYVPTLLQIQSPVRSISKLLQCGGTCPFADVQQIAVEAAWAAGAILCDAGVPTHPSTDIARVVLPVLCDVLDNKSSVAKLDVKREVLSACWNIVSAPPADMERATTEQNLEQAASLSRPVRDGFLAQLSSRHGLIASLVGLMRDSLDGDVVYLALSLLNAILRRLISSNPAVRREFLEAEGVEVLERVCDRASQAYANRGTTDDSADMAADLVDDLFGEEVLNDEEDENISSMMGAHTQSTGEATFSFGIPEGGSIQPFDFGQSLAVQPSSAFGQAQYGSGIGRGQGKTIPAWMHQREQS